MMRTFSFGFVYQFRHSAMKILKTLLDETFAMKVMLSSNKLVRHELEMHRISYLILLILASVYLLLRTLVSIRGGGY